MENDETTATATETHTEIAPPPPKPAQVDFRSKSEMIESLQARIVELENERNFYCTQYRMAQNMVTSLQTQVASRSRRSQ